MEYDMSASPTKSGSRLIPLALAAICAAGCGGVSRFALRPPLLRDGDDRPFAPPPAKDPESDYADTLNVTLLRPLSHAFLFEPVGEARNVSSLDEVPDSSWFTNRTVTPAELERGPCPDSGPVPPFVIKSSKGAGVTPGFVVKDARGHKYVIKIDVLAPKQPEIATAADAITSRLYWAVGFNAPCNDVFFADPADFRLDAKSVEVLKTGDEIPLTEARVKDVWKETTRAADGKLRLAASLFIAGEPLGTWRTEGVRPDDPNDVIPHEDRRELRGERLLAAWTAHWDSRGPNSFDAFQRTRDPLGYVVHYFLDFSESLGGTWTRTKWPEPRMGFTTVSNLPQIGVDILGFGFVRRPWDELRVDPRFPNLGFLDADHFEPMGFAPQTPMVRWARADPQDLAWMARRLARLGEGHVRAAVRTGRLPNAAEEDRLVELLLARRARILRGSFARVSPLSDVAMEGPDSLCVSDLGVSAGLAAPGAVSYAAALRTGAALTLAPSAPAVERGASPARLCVKLPHFAPATPPDDAAERYATVDWVRTSGAAKNTLRVHLYDLGAKRGHVLAGVERP